MQPVCARPAMNVLRSSQRQIVSKGRCSSFYSDNVQKVTQDTLAFAAKPITDVLERIDKRLANIERELTSRYVEKTDGTYVKMVPSEEAKDDSK